MFRFSHLLNASICSLLVALLLAAPCLVRADGTLFVNMVPDGNESYQLRLKAEGEDIELGTFSFDYTYPVTCVYGPVRVNCLTGRYSSYGRPRVPACVTYYGWRVASSTSYYALSHNDTTLVSGAPSSPPSCRGSYSSPGTWQADPGRKLLVRKGESMLLNVKTNLPDFSRTPRVEALAVTSQTQPAIDYSPFEFIPPEKPIDRLGIYSNNHWYLDKNGDGVWEASKETPIPLGFEGAVPAPGDWNGDGFTDLGLYAAGMWFRDTNGDGEWQESELNSILAYGWRGALPVVGDWDGDGDDDLGVYQGGRWYRDINGNALWDEQDVAQVKACSWYGALEGVRPVVGDWNGDGIDDMGEYYRGEWRRNEKGDGVCHDREPAVLLVVHRPTADMAFPVAGDWNGDGKDELGVYQHSTWLLRVEGLSAQNISPTFGSNIRGTARFLPVIGRWRK